SKGYAPGGYRRIATAIADSITARGGHVRLRSPVRQLDVDAQSRPVLHLSEGGSEAFDRVVYAGPFLAFPGLIGDGRLASAVAALPAAADMQGVVNVVLLLRRRLTPHYWVATIDRDVPFQGI